MYLCLSCKLRAPDDILVWKLLVLLDSSSKSFKNFSRPKSVKESLLWVVGFVTGLCWVWRYLANQYKMNLKNLRLINETYFASFWTVCNCSNLVRCSLSIFSIIVLTRVIIAENCDIDNPLSMQRGTKNGITLLAEKNLWLITIFKSLF
jgi:hypothetical protein